MKIKNLNNMAFSLLEVLLAAFIFVVTIGTVFITLDALRRPVVDKESALGAVVFGKQVLESLRSLVNAGTLYSSATYLCQGSGQSITCPDLSLALGTHQYSLVAQPPCVSGTLCWPSSTLAAANSCPSVATGCLSYTVSCADGGIPSGDTPPNCLNVLGDDIARRVDLTINWPSSL